MTESEYEYNDDSAQGRWGKAASTEQICHIVRKRGLLFGWRERKRWKDGFKYYTISSEELDELERRASA